MKKKSDPRHHKRERIVQELFSWQFRSKAKAPVKIQNIITSLPEINKVIEKSAPDRPIVQINRVDLSILRLAIYELVVEKKQPVKVVVDEAIELGKEFGSESSSGFINGVLGKVIQTENLQT